MSEENNNPVDPTGYIVKESDFYTAIKKVTKTLIPFEIIEVVQSKSNNKAKIRTTIGDFYCESHTLQEEIYMFVYPMQKESK